MSRFTRNGKQVLLYGQHFADACDELAAMQILNALRDIEERADRPRPALNLNTCRVRQEGDEMVCACSLRWAIDDPNPPLCVHREAR